MEHEGNYWDEAENKRLIYLFNAGIGIEEIAVLLQRTEPAVIQQIEKLDLYHRKENPIRRRRTEKAPKCLCSRCQMNRTQCSFCQPPTKHREEL